jgi:glutamine cyclotransferase
MPIAALLVAALATLTAFIAPGSQPTASAAPVEKVQVVRVYPHDATSFCQGLAVHQGQILEGTGQYGHSRLRLVDLESGTPRMDVRLNDSIFGEGVTVWGSQILQLTWRNGVILIYDATTLQQTGQVAYRQIDPRLREGWGLTHDGQHLILSDGSSTLRFIDPTTWKLVRTVRVKSGIRSIGKLNELEYVNGEILANVWYSDRIARIDPEGGRVNGWLDLSDIKPAEVRRQRESVLNGIAWDAENRRLFVTGKHWPKLFEISYSGMPR